MHGEPLGWSLFGSRLGGLLPRKPWHLASEDYNVRALSFSLEIKTAALLRLALKANRGYVAAGVLTPNSLAILYDLGMI